MNEHAKSYAGKLQQAQEDGTQDVMAHMVGGSFHAAGAIQKAILVDAGLSPQHCVVDVGCGSGRLAAQLRQWLTGRYVGMDVLPELYSHAEGLCQREDWSFYQAPGATIPEPDGSADFVTFFSVFTHLLAEDTYRYLRDAARVLRPGGRVVFSFLEFAIPCHWNVFDNSVQDETPGKVLNQFMDRDMIRGFAERLGFEVTHIYNGDIPHARLSEPVVWDDGVTMEGLGNLGQSVCVLTLAGKP